MKSPSLLAGRTVESRQLLFKILEHLPSFLLTHECPLVCSIAIMYCVPCLTSFFLLMFTYVFSISGQVPLLFTSFEDSFINI